MKSIFLFLIFSLTIGAQAGQIHKDSYWSIWGTRDYELYIPDSYHTSYEELPLIVALHGCMQSPTSFAGGTRLNEWAEKKGFAVLYPSQTSLYNIYNCWNWFFPINQMKSSGEAELVVGTITETLSKYKIDKDRVFVLGMSAGAAMSNILANCYPNMFQAVASHHGTMYKAAEDPFTAEDVVYNGSKLSPQIAGAKGYACQGLMPRKKLMPAVIIHGSKGVVMDPIHATQVETEFLVFNDYLDNGLPDDSLNLQKAEQTFLSDEEYGYDVLTLYKEDRPFIKRYMIEELGHAWSGGDNSYEFNDSHGPDATGFIIEFFENWGL